MVTLRWPLLRNIRLIGFESRFQTSVLRVRYDYALGATIDIDGKLEKDLIEFKEVGSTCWDVPLQCDLITLVVPP